jgi:sec-independent protein translocase protein TatB
VFNVSGGELIIILLVALVVLGPEKLPDAVRKFGNVYGELRRMANGFQEELRDALDEPTREMRDTVADMRTTFSTPFDTSAVASSADAVVPDGGPAVDGTDEAHDDGEIAEAADDGELTEAHDDGRGGTDPGDDRQDVDGTDDALPDAAYELFVDPIEAPATDTLDAGRTQSSA